MIDFSVIKRDKLTLATFIVACLWVCIQIILILVFGDHAQVPDARTYMHWAMKVYETKEIYPAVENIHDSFVHAPGMVNYLAIVYTIFGTFKIVLFINLLMNIAILCEVYYIAERFFNSKVACISVIIYCSILSSWFVPLHILSDHPSYFLFITGFLLSIQKKWYWITLAGIVYALGCTIRPTVLAFVIMTICYYIVKRRHFSHFLILLLSYNAVLFSIGKYNENKIGIYTNTSDMGGFALMHSANEKTTAAPDMTFTKDSTNSGYIANADQYTFAQKDSIWKSRAIQWIKDNPKRYISLAPQRFFRSFALDYWSMEDVWEYDNYQKAIHSENPSQALFLRHMKQFALSIPYYIMILLFLLSIYWNRKDIFSEKGVLLIAPILYMGTTFFFIAEHRSHYSFLFPLVMWAAYGISSYSKNKSLRATTHLS